MIDIISKVCIEEGCDKQSTYNFPDHKTKLYCNMHKKEGMINIKSKICIEEGCIKQSNYNFPNDKIKLYCNIHKKDGMINIRDKRCKADGCMMLAACNFITEKNVIFCRKHKELGMVDLKHPTCFITDCLARARYNFSNEKKGLYCLSHKEHDMINVIDKKCIFEGCDKLPSYNLPSETKPIYCFEHKEPTHISVKIKKCQEKDCKNESVFGLTNKKATRCNIHKEENMINLFLDKKCSIFDCNEEYFQLVKDIKYCNMHVPEDSMIVVKRLCKFCDIKEESKYICNDCKKVQNKKEWSIVRYLRKIIDTPFEYNSSKMLQGCSKKRPDIFFELYKYCIIVEIDENQHNSYTNSCECARINEIVNGIGGKSIILIRYNPDVIKNKNKKINIPTSERIDLLVKTIKDELVKDYNKFMVKVIQLYYNDDYEEYQQVKEEIITDQVCI
jgi:hypothetical protein